jgi:hypothetical protein
MTLSVNLAYAQFRPTVFTPVEYKPQYTDYSTLERSFQQQENRSNMAYQKYSELAQLIGEKRSKISNDKETLLWFSRNIDKKLEDVKTSLSVGDYQGAIERATRAMGDIISDIELTRRIQTYEEYRNTVEYIKDRTDLSYQQKQEWLDTYVYKFVPIYNSTGEIIGAYDWKEIGGPNNTRVILP